MLYAMIAHDRPDGFEQRIPLRALQCAVSRLAHRASVRTGAVLRGAEKISARA
jgi:hypothetical protein